MPDQPDRLAVPFSKEDYVLWTGNLDKSRQNRQIVSKWWDANLKKVAPSPKDDPEQWGGTLNTNRDYTLVERKKADLFFQRPDVTAIPSPLMEGQEALLDTHTKILNEKLGLDGVNAKLLVHRVLFDVLCPSGTGWTKMGYESVTAPVPEPAPQPGAILGLGANSAPAPIPVPIYEQCFWTHFSPKQGLVPYEATSTDFESWPWIGYEFEMPLRMAKRKGWVPPTFEGSGQSSEIHFDYGLKGSTPEAMVRGVELFYKSALYREDRLHPLHQTQLVLIDGLETPAVHQDCPYQTLGPTGELTPDSLIGWPIHPLALHMMTDTPYVPSNCTISRPLANELNRFREQMVLQRDSQVIVAVYNTDVMPTEAVQKAVKAPLNGLIGIPGEAFTGEGPFKQIERSPYPRENFQTNDYIDNDIARTWALDSNQQGVQSGEGQTATEAQLTQGNANSRQGVDRGFVLDWYIKGVTKYSSLTQRFLPVMDAAKIVGQDKAQAWDGWRKQVPAALAFTAMPDGALQSDLAWERKRAMDEYTFFANDPFINRQELLKQLLPRLHYSQNIIQTQPPEKGPDTPSVSFAVKAENLDPLSPSYGNIYQVMTQLGFKNLAQPMVDPVTAHGIQAQQEAMTKAQTAHGGKVSQMESLSKHQVEQTGGMQGSGAPAPQGAGGMVQ